MLSSTWSSTMHSQSLVADLVFPLMRRPNNVLRWVNNACLCPDEIVHLCVIWLGSISSDLSSFMSSSACGMRRCVALDSRITQFLGLIDAFVVGHTTSGSYIGFSMVMDSLLSVCFCTSLNFLLDNFSASLRLGSVLCSLWRSRLTFLSSGVIFLYLSLKYNLFDSFSR